jgi:hypothetical protein
MAELTLVILAAGGVFVECRGSSDRICWSCGLREMEANRLCLALLASAHMLFHSASKCFSTARIVASNARLPRHGRVATC